MEVFEEKEKMRYESSVEKIGIEKSMQQGEALALQKLLTKRFGAIPANIAVRIAAASLE